MSTLVACLLILPGSQSLLAQDREEESGFPDPLREIISFAMPFVLPKVFQDVHLLREYVASEEFRIVRSEQGDMVAVDRLFDEALRITWDNYHEALFISFVSTMNHRRFGLRLPLLGPLLWFPLTSEFEDEFKERVDRLPSRFYPDSPEGEEGDRDKLQHFFGSAFLASSFESAEASERVGQAVEFGEETFVVDGLFDDRDLRANRHGQMFGATLVDDRTARPSDFLQLVTASAAPTQRKPTAGTGIQNDGEEFRGCDPSPGPRGNITEEQR
jgi:hypothetical protein